MLRIGTLVWMLIGSLFCGIVMFSVALGSIFPNVNAIAGPLVCGNRKLEITQYTHSYTPGSVDTTTTDHCVDQTTGRKQEVTPVIVLVAGMMDSLIFFAVVVVGTLAIQLRHRYTGNPAAP